MSIRTFILNRARIRAGLALGITSEMFRDAGSLTMMHRLEHISLNQNARSERSTHKH